MKWFLSLVLASVMSVFMVGCSCCGKVESAKKDVPPPKQECKKACDQKNAAEVKGGCKAKPCCCKEKPCCACKKPAARKASAKKAAKKAVKQAAPAPAGNKAAEPVKKAAN